MALANSYACTAPKNSVKTPLVFTAQLSEYGIPLDGQAQVVVELTYGGTMTRVELTETRPGQFEGEAVTSGDGIYRARTVAMGRTLRGTRFTREQTHTASVYTPRPPEEDPKAPENELPPSGGLGPKPTCADVFAALVSVLEKDRQLTNALNKALRQERVTLKQLVNCLQSDNLLGIFHNQSCARAFTALLQVMQRDRRLAKAVDQGLRRERITLKQLVSCLQERIPAGGQTFPGFIPPVLNRPVLGGNSPQIADLIGSLRQLADELEGS